jgi:hypothetical protein
MHKLMTGLFAALVLTGSATFAFADEPAAPAATDQTASTAVPPKVVCHHDGEIIQALTGPVICHKRPQSRLHDMSREWFREQQLRSASMNH